MIHLLFRYFNALLVFPPIELGFDSKSEFGAGVCDEFDDGFESAKRFATPVVPRKNSSVPKTLNFVLLVGRRVGILGTHRKWLQSPSSGLRLEKSLSFGDTSRSKFESRATLVLVLLCRFGPRGGVSIAG